MDTGRLLNICLSARKGIAKHQIAEGNFIFEHGLEGDAHAGDWHRQVSLLAHLDIEFMRSKGLNLKPGAFGENLVIDGIDTNRLGVGSRLKIGEVLLELTQIGKTCHTRCAIYYSTGDCIMPRTGLFARVLEGGRLVPGLPVQVVRVVNRSVIHAAVVTVSDRCSRGETIDTAGPAVAALLRERLDTHIAWMEMVPDEAEQITRLLNDLVDRRVDLIVTTGGTGISGRDVTPEATRQVIDRELPGLGEAMRVASSCVTRNAWLSRALAGIRQQTLIVNLPGSLCGAVENLGAILPLLPHAIDMLRGDNLHDDLDDGRRLISTSEVRGTS